MAPVLSQRVQNPKQNCRQMRERMELAGVMSLAGKGKQEWKS